MKKSKKKSGRRPLYETPEQLQEAVDRYFESIKGKPLFDKKGQPVTDRHGVQKTDGKPPTMTGLSRFLGFKDRQTFTRQGNRSSVFNDVVSEARLRIEDFWEQALYNGDTYQGAVFMLTMCFGWRKNAMPDPLPDGVPLVQIINRPMERAEDETGEKMAVHTLNINLLN